MSPVSSGLSSASSGLSSASSGQPSASSGGPASSPSTGSLPTSLTSLPQPVAARARRQPRWIAAGLLAICLGALGAVLLFTEATSSHGVVVVAADVARGEVIEQADLTTTTIGSTRGVNTVPADQLTVLIGQRATVDLLAGTLLPAGAIGDPVPKAGFVQLGLRLAPGRIPLDPLPAGTPVLLVAVADPGATAGAGTTSSVDPTADKTYDAAVVRSAELSNDGQFYLLDVQVPSQVAAEVARLAAADRIVLIRQPEG